MKLNKHIFAISLGTAMVMAMVMVVSIISVPKAPSAANAGDKAVPIILASAQSPAQSPTLSPAQSNVAAAGATQFQSVPVPCPIWMLNEMIGQNNKTSESADGGKRSPQLVPAGIWFMQKFGEALRKTL